MAKEKGQRTNNNLKNNTQKTKDRTRSPLQTGVKSVSPGRVSSFCFTTSGTRRATLVTNFVLNEERTGECLQQVKLIDGHL